MDPAKLVVRRFEELVQVLILGDVALLEEDTSLLIR